MDLKSHAAKDFYNLLECLPCRQCCHTLIGKHKQFSILKNPNISTFYIIIKLIKLFTFITSQLLFETFNSNK